MMHWGPVKVGELGQRSEPGVEKLAEYTLVRIQPDAQVAICRGLFSSVMLTCYLCFEPNREGIVQVDL